MRLALLSAVLLLAGCDLGPDYTQPELDIPPAWRATPAAAAQAWPGAEWWRGFNSPELNRLIDDARAGSFDIQAAIARVHQADAQLAIAGAPLLPAVSATGQANWDRSSASTRRSSLGGLAGSQVRYFETRTYSLTPAISYELDFWGKVRAGREAAYENALFTRFDQQTVALTTITSVASTWFQALAQQDRIDVARRNLDDAEQILAAIQARLEAGTASELDVSQQAALVAGIRAQIPGLQSTLEQDLDGLGVLVGQKPESITVRPGTLTTLSLPEIAPGLPSDLILRRPDVAAAEAQLAQANANVKVARADFFPQITLSGQSGWQSIALGTLFGPGSFFASATATAAQAIFDNGQKQSTLEENRARYDELLAEYRKAVVQAFTDVENGMQAYHYATEQEAAEQNAVATAQRAADIARAQVLAGTLDIVSALQAQTTLYNDLDLLAQARLNRFQALLSLYKALGGGWSNADINAPDNRLFHGVL
jgi:NodT family efflux transporter outer membrane factor (OMF) lipoprotein